MDNRQRVFNSLQQNNFFNFDLIFNSDNFAKSLIATYDMYCHGYGFLDNVALGYGITFANVFLNLTRGVTYPRRKKLNESMPSLQVLKLKRKKFDLGSTTRKLF